jgi:hypothetical protein
LGHVVFVGKRWLSMLTELVDDSNLCLPIRKELLGWLVRSATIRVKGPVLVGLLQRNANIPYTDSLGIDTVRERRMRRERSPATMGMRHCAIG